MKHAIAVSLVLAVAGGCSSKAASSSGAAEPAGARGEPGGHISGSEDCDGLVIMTVTPEAVELDRVARTIPRRDGAIDAEALRPEMEPADPDAACAHAADIGARGNVTYADLVAAMDVAIAGGRREIGLIGGSVMKYPSRRRLKQPTDEEFFAAMAKPAADPANAPVLVVARGSITLRLRSDGKDTESVIDDRAPLGDFDALQGLQEQLREVRSTEAPGTGGGIVVQADRATPAALVIEVAAALKAAGYDNILFAVKMKP